MVMSSKKGTKQKPVQKVKKPVQKVKKSVKKVKKPVQKVKQLKKVQISQETEKKKPKNDKFLIIDQTIERIRDFKIQGANDIAQASVRALREVAFRSQATNRNDFLSEIGKAGEMLKESRPTEPALRNSINNIVKSTERYELKSIDNVKKYAIRTADNLLRQLTSVVETISEIGSEEIRDDDIIITHCHSEQVIQILLAAKEKKKKFSVIVTETRPLNQGLITAKELSEANIDVTYIIDSAAATVMKKATKMIIGADAILADGSIVNKIGTYSMALLAKQFQTPVYVAAETLKFDPITLMGAAEPIEERDPDEVAEKMKGVIIINPAFDVTPADLVSALLTEKGVMKPELIRENVENII